MFSTIYYYRSNTWINYSIANFSSGVFCSIDWINSWRLKSFDLCHRCQLMLMLCLRWFKCICHTDYNEITSLFLREVCHLLKFCHLNWLILGVNNALNSLRFQLRLLIIDSPNAATARSLLQPLNRRRTELTTHFVSIKYLSALHLGYSFIK